MSLPGTRGEEMAPQVRVACLFADERAAAAMDGADGRELLSRLSGRGAGPRLVLSSPVAVKNAQDWGQATSHEADVALVFTS